MQKKIFDINAEWKSLIPVPVYEDRPEYTDLYWKAWELAHDHIIDIPGMPQTPYMDEAFCDTDIWIWDTCFMSLYCKYAQCRFPGIESLNNFYEVLHDGKQLPLIISQNAPEWAAKAGEKKRIVIHILDNPPLFAWAELNNARISGDRNHVRKLLLEKQYLQKHFAMLENLTSPIQPDCVRNVSCLIKHPKGFFWEGGRSGMDNTPRGRTGKHAYEDRPNHPRMLWVDALAQQGLAANCIARLAEIIGEEAMVSEWQKKYENIKATINRYYWDEQDGFYFDIHADTLEFMKVMTPASFWPLASMMAEPEMAEKMFRLVSDERKFGGTVPLVSLARDDADFNAEDGRYWRGAMWVPTAYMSIKGIENYGHFELARKCADGILNHMYLTFRDYEPHTIWETYNPCSPMPSRSCDENNRIVRPDFCGWSAVAPINLYIENVIGIYSIDAFKKQVKWHVGKEVKGKIGLRNLRFGDVVTDLLCDQGVCEITSSAPYTLYLNDKEFGVQAGTNRFAL